MRPVHAVTAAVLLALGSSAVHAQTAQSTPIPANTKPDFSAWNFRVGTWACSVKVSDRPTPFTYKITWSLDPAGFWLVGKSATKGTAWYPHPGTATSQITYDGDTKRFIDVFVDPKGDYDFSVSSGWAGNKIVWHDLAFAPTADVRSLSDDTWTKVSDVKTTSYQTYKNKMGKTVTEAGTCTKST